MEHTIEDSLAIKKSIESYARMKQVDPAAKAQLPTTTEDLNSRIPVAAFVGPTEPRDWLGQS